MKKQIDWTAVARARRKLGTIKGAHPELSGASHLDHWTSSLVEDETMAETQQKAFRLPVELLQRLDSHVKRLQEATPGMTISLTDVVRIGLTQFLDEVEKQTKQTKQSSKSKRR